MRNSLDDIAMIPSLNITLTIGKFVSNDGTNYFSEKSGHKVNNHEEFFHNRTKIIRFWR